VGQDIERADTSLKALYLTGALSDAASEALAIVKAAAEIGAALGEHSAGDELVLASILVDDSTSIADNIGEIRSGHGHMLEALRAERFEADVQVQTRALNKGLLSPCTSLATATPLTERNYNSARLVAETPLYLQSILTLGTVMTKAQEEETRGVTVRTFTLIVTDGHNNSLNSIRASHVRAIVTDMREFATNHIVAAMGIGEPRYFKSVFQSMGIPQDWIFTPGSSVEELRRMFRWIAHCLALAASSDTAFAQLLPGPPPDSP
jgi:hypothetical protein